MDKIKKIILYGIIGVMILSVVYLQYGREMKVSGSSHSSTTETISVVVNKIGILNKNAVAWKIVRKCQKNNFKNVRFSYDIRKPERLHVTVYLNEYQEEHGNISFEFSYVADENSVEDCNYIDNPELYQIVID